MKWKQLVIRFLDFLDRDLEFRKQQHTNLMRMHAERHELAIQREARIAKKERFTYDGKKGRNGLRAV